MDVLANVRRIGIDESSDRRVHRYLLVVVCHDTGRLSWAAEGRNQRTLQGSFDALGEERCRLVTHVSCDAAAWVHACVKQKCPHAVICMGAFHVLQSVNDAVDEVRRRQVKAHRDEGRVERATSVKGTRWALLKAPEKLTEKQWFRLSDVERLNRPLYRTYLLKEHVRLLLKRPPAAARSINGWCGRPRHALSRWRG